MAVKLTLILGMVFFLANGQANTNENWLEVESDICDYEEIFELVKSENYFSLDLVEKTGCIGYYTKDSGPSWLTVESNGTTTGVPNDSHEGYNDFYITCRPMNQEALDIKLTIYVDCGS